MDSAPNEASNERLIHKPPASSGDVMPPERWV